MAFRYHQPGWDRGFCRQVSAEQFGGSPSNYASPLNRTKLTRFPLSHSSLYHPHRILSVHPDISCLFLNSGIQRPLSFTDPSSISLPDIHLEFTTNYFSYIYFLKYVLPHFQCVQKEKDTAVVLVGSVLGLVPLTRCGNYCATKVRVDPVLLFLPLLFPPNPSP